MSWSAIERRIAAATTKPASISLHCVVRKGTPISKPMCQVTLRFALASQLDWKRNEPVGVAIGEGEHAGLMRVTRNSPSVVGKCRILTRDGISFNLGHIPQFGLTGREKRSIDGRIIDADTVELVLPDWSQPDSNVGAPGAAADEDDEAEPVAAEHPSTAMVPAIVPPRVVAKDVTVVFEDENEHVIFRGNSMEVTTRQAKFLSVLARVKPEPCGRTEIIERMWGSQPPNNVNLMLDQIASDLINALAPIGLTVNAYKGVGFALRECKVASCRMMGTRDAWSWEDYELQYGRPDGSTPPQAEQAVAAGGAIIRLPDALAERLTGHAERRGTSVEQLVCGLLEMVPPLRAGEAVTVDGKDVAAEVLADDAADETAPSLGSEL